MSQKRIAFSLISILLVLCVGFAYFYFSGLKTTKVPDYMTEQFSTSLKEKHEFTITKSGDSYSLVDTKSKNIYLISSSSTIDLNQLLDKKFLLSGKLLITQHDNVRVFGAEDKNISAVVVQIDGAQIVER